MKYWRYIYTSNCSLEAYIYIYIQLLIVHDSLMITLHEKMSFLHNLVIPYILAKLGVVNINK